MYDTNSLFKFKKMRSGDLVLEFTPNVSRETLKSLIKWSFKFIFKIFSPIFYFFDKLAEKRKLVISSVGFGIGLGLSIIVTQRPDTLQAFPVFENISVVGTQAKIIKFPRIGFYELVKGGNLSDITQNVFENELIHVNGSGFLGQKSPVVIADLGTKNLLHSLESVKIGDEVVVIGKNNGTYKYRVIEIREIDSQYLNNVIDQAENSVVIYRSQNLLRTQLYIVVAKPYL